MRKKNAIFFAEKGSTPANGSRHASFYLSLLLFLTLSFSCRRQVETRDAKITVAAASSQHGPLEEMAEAFYQKTGIRAELVFAASGKIANQILQDAPFDIFISADTVYPNLVVQKGFNEGEPVVFAHSSLALLVRKEFTPSNAAGIGEILTNKQLKNIAIANPKVAPFGAAAEKYLHSFGDEFYSSIQPKLVFAENVSQVATLVLSGSADAGIISNNMALDPSEDFTVFELLPPEAEEVPQSLVILKNDSPEKISYAKEFVRFLQSEKGKQVLSKYKY